MISGMLCVNRAALAAAAITAIFGVTTAIACGGAPAATAPTPTSPPDPQIGMTQSPTPKPADGAKLSVALASTDVSVGENRVAFGLINPQTGPVEDAQVQVSTYRPMGDSHDGPVDTVNAEFHSWPVSAGVYTTQLSFDKAGVWGLLLKVNTPNGEEVGLSTSLEVSEESATPALGSPAPRSDSKTVDDVSSMDQLTTDPNPDPDLYQMTIAKALDTGKPLVVTFATPLYCSSSTCGPQVDVVKEVKNEHKGEANFIHVEIYDNPHEIEGDLSRAVLSPTLSEWGLPSEPWTFVIDSDGMVQAKFEGFVTKKELEEALAQVLS